MGTYFRASPSPSPNPNPNPNPKPKPKPNPNPNQVAENTMHAGLPSASLQVATRGLRATLYSECGHRTEVHSPASYQGCFRDGPASRPLLLPPTEGPTFSHQLDLLSCAAR